MKATINGISIEGTPQEIMEYQRMQADKAVNPNAEADRERFIQDMRRNINQISGTTPNAANNDYVMREWDGHWRNNGQSCYISG